MSTVLARCLGMAPEHQITEDAAVVVLQRRSTLTYTEARLVVLDYMGGSLETLSAALQVHPESLRTYWKRIYRKLACSDRQRIRAWLEDLLLHELGAPHVAERLAANPLWSSGAAAS